MTITIDPCTACLKKYPIKKVSWPGNQINNLEDLNHCIFNTAAEFEDGYNSALAQEGQKCIESSIATSGRNPQSYRLSRPLILPSQKYFRPFLKKNSIKNENDLNRVYDMCVQTCVSGNCANIGNCIANCKRAKDAIFVNTSLPTQSENHNIDTTDTPFEYNYSQNLDKNDTSPPPKNNSVCLILIIVSIIVIMIMIGIIFILKKK